jgi:hypothetical protein
MWRLSVRSVPGIPGEWRSSLALAGVLLARVLREFGSLRVTGLIEDPDRRGVLLCEKHRRPVSPQDDGTFVCKTDGEVFTAPPPKTADD